MKLLSLLAAAVLLSSSASAQLFPIPPGGLPPLDFDPVLANVSKSKSYGTIVGFTNANLQFGMNGYANVFAVQDDTEVLGRARAGAKAYGLATLLGSAVLGATARVDADAANATWSYASNCATVTSATDYAKLTGFMNVGPYTLLDQTKAFYGDVAFAPSFSTTESRHIFDVTWVYTIIPGIDLTVNIGADAGAKLSVTSALDPFVASTGGTGSKAKATGTVNGWVTGYANFTIGNFCANAGINIDLRLADSTFSGSLTADRNAVTGSIGFTEKPIAILVKGFWSGLCVPNGSKTLWNWTAPIYSVTYAL